jgi:hypothetical protein
MGELDENQGVGTAKFDKADPHKRSLDRGGTDTMKRNKRLLALGLCALMTFSLVCATNLFAEDVQDEGTIIGTVNAVAWDDDDNVIAVSIMSSSGEEYAIVNNTAGRNLFGLDNKVVKATGVVSEDSEGNKSFTVTNYEIMPE